MYLQNSSEEARNKQSFLRSFQGNSFAHESTRIPQKQESQRKHLMDAFMKDMPPETKNPQVEAAKATNPATSDKTSSEMVSTVHKLKKLSFLPCQDNNNFFELNAETEMFGTNISMIKNSTWLPNHGPTNSCPKQLSQIQEDSLHIKDEASSNVSQQSSKSCDMKQSKLSMLLKPPKSSFNASRLSIDMSASEIAALKQAKFKIPVSPKVCHEEDADNDNEMSIYYKHTPKTPKNVQVHVWEDDLDDLDELKTPVANNRFQHTICDLNQTNQIIENICVDPNVNPFNSDLISAFLDQINFTSFVEDLPNCELVRRIHCLQPTNTIKVNDVKFNVLKLVGEGSYGAVYK